MPELVKKKKTEIDLVNGTTKELIKKMILFTLPIILVGIFELLYTAFDLIVVQGHNGSLAAAAVGANNSLISLITSLFLGLGNGVNVVIARTYGKEDKEGCSKALHTSMIVAFLGGIAIGAFGFFMARYFLEWMNVDSSYIDLAQRYLQVYFIGMPFLSIYNFGISALRGIGNSTTPFIILVITGIINVILNYTFVDGMNLTNNIDAVSAVGLTTVISEFLSSVLVVLYFMFSKSFVNFSFKKLRVDMSMFKAILKIGIPSGLQGMVFSISNVMLQSSVNTWGADVVAANSDASSLEGFTYISMFAVSSTSSAFTSANYGRGYKENVKKVFYTTCILAVSVGIVIGAITLIFSDQLFNIYMGANPDPVVKSYATQRLWVILSTYFLCGLMDCICGSLRGLGYVVSPLLITIISCCIFRIFWDKCIYSDDVNSPMHSLAVLYMCYPISWAIAVIGELIIFYSCRKKYNARIDENLKNYENKDKTYQF